MNKDEVLQGLKGLSPSDFREVVMGGTLHQAREAPTLYAVGAIVEVLIELCNIYEAQEISPGWYKAWSGTHNTIQQTTMRMAYDCLVYWVEQWEKWEVYPDMRNREAFDMARKLKDMKLLFPRV